MYSPCNSRRCTVPLEIMIKMEDFEDWDVKENSGGGINTNSRVTLKGKENTGTVKSTKEAGKVEELDCGSRTVRLSIPHPFLLFTSC